MKIGTDFRIAQKYLEAGGLVAIPTETVYGLAANALNLDAVIKIFSVKNRPFFDPLIVHCPSLISIQNYVSEIPAWASLLLERFSPGGITVLLPKKYIIPDIVTSGLPRVGIRIPNHPLTLALLQALSFPLAAPSANPFGYISPTTAKHVHDQLADAVDYILDGGPCSVGVESTIVGEEAGKIVLYRQGAVSLEQLEKILERPIDVKVQGSKPDSPGMLDAHYAPRKRLFLMDFESAVKRFPGKKLAHLAFQHPHSNAYVSYTLTISGTVEEAAQHLFEGMRRLDASDADVIIADNVPNIGLGRAILDRLRRASAQF